MFADNEKISLRQAGRLLVMDQMGKMCLLLPAVLEGVSGWNQIAALLLGGVWSLIYAGILADISGRVDGNITEYTAARLGKWAAWFMAVVFLLYFWLCEAYLLRVTGTICRLFLLPEVSENVIAVLTALAGLAVCQGSAQRRGRTGECLYPLTIGVFLVVLLIALADVNPQYLQGLENFRALPVVSAGGMVFAAFSGIGAILYELPFLQKNGSKAEIFRMLKRRLGFLLIVLTLFWIAALGAFGSRGMTEMDWPLVMLMGNTSLPGGFLQKWDGIFLAFLLMSLLMASASGFYYMNKMVKELPLKISGRKCLIWEAVLSLLPALAAGTAQKQTELLFKWGFGGTAPVMILIPVLLWVLERIGDRCKK